MPPAQTGLLLVDAQGWKPARARFLVAEWRAGEVSALRCRPFLPAPQPFFDQFQLLAGEERLQLRVVFIHFVVKVIRFLRGDDFDPRMLESFQNDALLAHGTPSQAVHIHAEHGFIAAFPHIPQQAEHFRPCIEVFPACHLLVYAANEKAHGAGCFLQRFAVAAQRVLRAFPEFLRAGFPQIEGCFHLVNLFPRHSCRLCIYTRVGFA